MNILLCAACSLLPAALALASPTEDPLTRPIHVETSAKWNRPQMPLRIYGDTYYVGMHGLSSVLIHGDHGSILLDGDLPQSALEIEAHIRELGFRLDDVKLILNSHAHFDHAGGIAALQRDTGAEVAASPSGAAALRAGSVAADDPQAGFKDNGFPAVARVREVGDGETLHVGNLAVTAHFTPGHTPGSTTWTWRSCESGRCLDIVYADSLNAVAAPGFRYLGDGTHPGRTAGFFESIAKVAGLPCDILISVHPDVAGVDEKLAELEADPERNPFVGQKNGCREYATSMEKALEQRIDQEKAVSTPARQDDRGSNR